MFLLDFRHRIAESTLTLWIVVIVIIAAAIETDVFVPSFPAMQDYFGTTPAMIQMILSVNFVGLCVSGFFYGPLADAYGRRPVLLTGLTIFTLSSIGAIMSTTIDSLLIMRFLQGVGSSACFIVAGTIIYDRYNQEKAIQILGLYNTIITLTLAFAPIIGSYLHILLGWQANFILVALLALISWLLVAFFYEESLPQEKRIPIKINTILQGYFQVLTHVKSLSCMLIIFSIFSAFIIYVGNLSFIFINTLHISETLFGFYQSSVLLSFALASIFSGRIIARLGMDNVLLKGMLISFTGACLLLMVAWTRANNPFLISASMMLFSAGFALVVNIIWSTYMAVFPDIKGIASALITSLRLLVTALALSLASLFFNGTIVPIAHLIFMFSTIATVALFILLRYDKPTITANNIEPSKG